MTCSRIKIFDIDMKKTEMKVRYIIKGTHIVTAENIKETKIMNEKISQNTTESRINIFIIKE